MALRRRAGALLATSSRAARRRGRSFGTAVRRAGHLDRRIAPRNFRRAAVARARRGRDGRRRSFASPARPRAIARAGWTDRRRRQPRPVRCSPTSSTTILDAARACPPACPRVRGPSPAFACRPTNTPSVACSPVRRRHRLLLGSIGSDGIALAGIRFATFDGMTDGDCGFADCCVSAADRPCFRPARGQHHAENRGAGQDAESASIASNSQRRGSSPMRISASSKVSPWNPRIARFECRTSTIGSDDDQPIVVLVGRQDRRRPARLPGSRPRYATASVAPQPRNRRRARAPISFILARARAARGCSVPSAVCISAGPTVISIDFVGAAVDRRAARFAIRRDHRRGRRARLALERRACTCGSGSVRSTTVPRVAEVARNSGRHGAQAQRGRRGGSPVPRSTCARMVFAAIVPRCPRHRPSSRIRSPRPPRRAPADSYSSGCPSYGASPRPAATFSGAQG